MELVQLWSFFFLAVVGIATAASLYLSIRLLYKLFLEADQEEESISLVAAARRSACLTKTPLLGEATWYVMMGAVIVTLIFRAGRHNSIKLAMQLEWKYEGSDEESNAQLCFL
jgi:hypothetical protein